MNAWQPQASYPCGNFSDTSSLGSCRAGNPGTRRQGRRRCHRRPRRMRAFRCSPWCRSPSAGRRPAARHGGGKACGSKLTIVRALRHFNPPSGMRSYCRGAGQKFSNFRNTKIYNSWGTPPYSWGGAEPPPRSITHMGHDAEKNEQVRGTLPRSCCSSTQRSSRFT